jgi:hypothetical protein
LISAEPQGQQKLSAAESRRNAENGLVSAARDTYTLTMAGRPVLKPGDVVVTEVDTVEAAVFGGFGLPPLPAGLETSTEIELYVNSVQHRLGKNIGWITTVTGVVVDLGSAPEGVWDMATPAEADSGSAGGGNRDDADPARAVVHHIRNETQAMMRLRERPRVGEVRANNHATEIGDQVVSKAAQSLDLLIGLDVPDGKPRRARRQELRRVDERRLNVPYLTPFAWGPYGLVLPHYPGERVLVVFHEDSTDDPVVLGSFWQTAQLSDTSAPPNVEPGDWWLILPAGLDAAARQSVAGADSVALPSDAKAVHDLITAEGERIIEIAGITVRSVPTDELGTPQGRPTGGANGGLLIEHKNGARIHIDAEGGITVQAKKKLILKADEEVEIEGSSIKLKGSSVDVE